MYHDTYWDEPGVPPVDPQRLLAALLRALKPGAVVGVIDYVGEPGDTRAIVNRLHRIDPATVRSDFERAGFVLEAESDLLRVPSDDHNRPAIDPAMRGRTDLFVYRFRKPRRNSRSRRIRRRPGGRGRRHPAHAGVADCAPGDADPFEQGKAGDGRRLGDDEGGAEPGDRRGATDQQQAFQHPEKLPATIR